MSKEVIIQRVPTDIRYVFVWKEFELSNYPKKCIIDKGIISSGFVNYCFNYNNRNMIFVESNQIERENFKMLFDDKAYLYDEYTNLKTSLEYRDFSSYLNSRIESNKPIKIITSPTDYYKVIEFASRIDKCDDDIFNMLAQSYYRIKDYDNASICYNKLIENKKSSFELYNNLAVIYYLKKDYDLLLNTYNRYIDNFDLREDNFASYNIFLLSYTLLKGNIIKYNDFLDLFEKSLNKTIEFHNIHKNNSYYNLYKNINYNTDTLKLLLDKKIETENIFNILESTIDSGKFTAIKPVIENFNKKMNIDFSSFSSSIKNLDDDNIICIEYEASDSIIIKTKNYNEEEKIYGKTAKFITKEDNIHYDTLLSIFSYNSEDYDYRAILNNNNIKIKIIYFPKNFDDSNIEIIRRIINDESIKLCKENN